MLKFLKKTLIVLIGLVLVVLVSGYVWIHPGRGPVEKVDPNEKGYAENIDGTLVLHLKGSPYEMGYQRGSLAKDKAQLMVRRFDELLEKAKKEMGLPKFAANLILDITYQLCSPYIPDRYKREMEGLADGSGTDLQVIRRGPGHLRHHRARVQFLRPLGQGHDRRQTLSGPQFRLDSRRRTGGHRRFGPV